MGAARWAWLRAVEAHPDGAALRQDGAATLRLIASAIAWAAESGTMRSRPTLARLMAVTGKSERTCQRWTRWMERRRLLAVWEPGTTPRFRPAILRRGGGSLAREWDLTLPPVHENGTPVVRFCPSGSDPVGLDRDSPTRARDRAPRHLRRRRQREGQGQNDRRSAPGSPPRPSVVPTAPPWPLGRNPRQRPERLGAAEALRGAHPVLARLSPRELRSALRPFHAAGWTGADVLWAIERDRDGSPLGFGAAVIVPARWLRWRLAKWTGPDGTPLPPRSRELAAEREHVGQLQAQRRAEAQRLAAAAADPAPHADRIRASLGWQSRNGARHSALDLHSRGFGRLNAGDPPAELTDEGSP